MKNEIFRRIEKKYVINKEQYEELKKALEGHMREDRYGRSVVCNIYFDSDDYSLIRNSITKPYYKDKVRLRSYNTPDEDSKVFLEIKRKCGKVVGKRRIEMNLNQVKNI
jgi:SPX domain protein involved in polyphosphate accumulation